MKSNKTKGNSSNIYVIGAVVTLVLVMMMVFLSVYFSSDETEGLGRSVRRSESNMNSQTRTQQQQNNRPPNQQPPSRGKSNINPVPKKKGTSKKFEIID